MTSDLPQYRVEQLTRFYSDLTEVLAGLGLDSPTMNQVLARCVTVECTLCGFQASGEDLGRVALANEPGELPEQKLARLRQGYCGRNGCESYFYRVRFTDCQGLNWPDVVERLQQRAAPAAAEKFEVSPGSGKRRLNVRLALGFAVLVGLLAWRFLTGESSPIQVFKKEPKYTVDPASLGPSPGP